MDTVTLAYAKEHLEELVARAAAGEDVRISAPGNTNFELKPVSGPSRKKVVIGALKGKMQDIPPDRLLAPLTEDELRMLSGEESEP
jgi:antitoxin (DNA-binding transcriptional repressor) of toxin-antitoxin stability system